MSYWQKYERLEEQPGWQNFVGADIGGTVPDDYGYIQNVAHPSLDGNSMQMHVTGKNYADWLTHFTVPTDKRTKEGCFAFSLLPDSNSAVVAQAIEFDVRISLGGMNYNFSLQLNYAAGGRLQTTNAGGGWVDTPYLIGKLEPNRWHSVKAYFVWDFAKKTGSYLSIVIDGKEYPVNVSCPVENLGWDDVSVFQLQQDTTQSGGTFKLWFDEVTWLAG